METEINQMKQGDSLKPLVLIIDDDQDLVEDLSFLLEPHFKVLSSTRSGLGMQILLKYRPDCVLLDIRMEQHFGQDKRREGLAFLRELRHNPDYVDVSNTPVILISGSDVVNEQRDPVEWGANGFLKKPLDINLLIQEITDIKAH